MSWLCDWNAARQTQLDDHRADTDTPVVPPTANSDSSRRPSRGCRKAGIRRQLPPLRAQRSFPPALRPKRKRLLRHRSSLAGRRRTSTCSSKGSTLTTISFASSSRTPSALASIRRNNQSRSLRKSLMRSSLESTLRKTLSSKRRLAPTRLKLLRHQNGTLPDRARLREVRRRVLLLRQFWAISRARRRFSRS